MDRVRLSAATLGNCPPAVIRPSYPRDQITVGIVHLGLGNFHRTHQAVYVDRCLAAGARDWGICGVELIDSEANRAKADAYRAQDCLYTVTEFDPGGAPTSRVIGSMVEYRHAPADPEGLIERMADPATRIVSLTITEGGYNLDETTGAFKLDTPDVAADLKGASPRTAFGFIVEALRRRRAAGTKPFTVMSCDNLRHNGDTARKAVVSFARVLDPGLADWIDASVTFPNAMVDRIAPQVPPEVRERVNAISGIDDKVPAMSESFMQWVIEDRFCDGRPALDTVGVEMRDDVVAFEHMKGRMLNASHILLGYPALLCGYRIVHEALGDPRLRRLLRDFLNFDVIPRLDGPKGVSLEAYRDAVLERFANPAVNDQLLRIGLDGASKLPVFHSRTLEMLLADGGALDREAYLFACFDAYLKGKDDGGQAFPVVEPRISEADWALIRGGDPLAVLRTSSFARLGLADHKRFAERFLHLKTMIAEGSAARALEEVVALSD